MHKNILTLLVFVFSILFLEFSASAQSSEYIQQFNSQIQINKDGTIDVIEIIKYNFPDQRHGIYRQIPKVKINNKGKRFLLTFSDISVKNEVGVPYMYSDQSTNDEIYLKIGDPNKTITGLHTYVISYKVGGALTYFDDHDELYWNVTGTEWNIPINEVLVNINLLGTSSVETYCYSGVQGSTRQNCLVSSQGSTSKIRAVNLGVGEGITTATSFNKGVVAVLEPRPDVVGYFQRLFTLILSVGGIVVGFLWYVFLPVKTYLNWKKDKDFTKKNEKIVAAWFDPPKNDDGSLYTAAETGSLIDKSIDFRDITASIIQLAQKKFLKIHVDDKKNFSFEKLRDFDGANELRKSEKDILSGIFSGSKTMVDAKSLKNSTKFASSVSNFKTSLSKELSAKKLFEKDFTKVSANNVALGFFALFFTGNIFLAIAAFVFGARSAKRTLLGVEKYSEAKSLENFLKSQDEQLDYQAKNQMFFEKLLPYATAFGVEDIWAKRFSDLQFTQSDWYDGDVNNALLYSALSSNIRNTISSSVSNASRSSSSGFSSGGGGGGSSGGGGGGGGGGSW